MPGDPINPRTGRSRLEEQGVGSRDYAAGYEEGFHRGQEESRARINELLEANNRYQQEARDARAEVKRLLGIPGAAR